MKKGNIIYPKNFMQYGNELKTMCAILNTEGIVALDRLSAFIRRISHEALNISKGSAYSNINTCNFLFF